MRCPLKSAHSCRLCRRWLEGEWSRATPEERVEIQRQMTAGHCDDCHRKHCTPTTTESHMGKIISVAVAAVAITVVGLIAYAVWWEANDPGHGTITGKNHRAASVTCTTTNKVTTCTNHPECYRIAYTDGRHDGDACVTALEYDRYRIGDTYPASDGE